MVLTGAAKAFLRRCLASADVLYAACLAPSPEQGVPQSQLPMQFSQTQVGSHVQPELAASRNSLLGVENSALRVAELLSQGADKPGASTLLNNAKLSEVLDEICPTSEVFFSLSLDSTAAKRQGPKFLHMWS